MNTSLSTVPGRHDHPPQPVRPEVHHRKGRVGFVDRLALHLGVALVTWSRRPLAVDSRITADAREDLARRHENRLAEAQRRCEVERSARMTVPGI